MNRRLAAIFSFACGLGIALASAEPAQEVNCFPCADQSVPTTVYWGDTHVHTNMSVDAIGLGNRLTAEQSYRFAKGEEVTTNTGQRVKLSRPLDFLVVTDHAEYLGVVSGLVDGLPPRNDLEHRWLRFTKESKFPAIMQEYLGILGGNSEWTPTKEEKKTAWHRVVDNAERHNNPGQFTAFIGYEWSNTEGPIHLHRNVIFRDGEEKAKQTVPFSALDSKNPEDLWNFLENYEKTTGGQVLAIPHNPNLSEGGAFPDAQSSESIVDSEYARIRSRWEPLLEVTQAKGDSETHPLLSPDDQFADFERMSNPASYAVEPELIVQIRQGEYARSALKRGLVAESTFGANPYRMGLIGSTDTHIAVSSAVENNYFGNVSPMEPSENRIALEIIGFRFASFSASGYAAVWAHENTRASIFDAMRRREVYATTGPRMTVRFFGGWGLKATDAVRSDLAKLVYSKGVPMGGILHQVQEFSAPGFIVSAVRDPIGANLDRIQVIKGWVDAEGTAHEKVYDVALSDERAIDSETGTSPSVGSTVNLGQATYTNDIGDGELLTFWEDPDFHPSEPAFYYARVLEIPTPRWTTYDAVRYGRALPSGVPATIQERAYTSPIWYEP